METRLPKSSSIGYGKPPWKFKGSALYQLHLVKSEIAKALIPKEFRLVEAFGFTLGGFFLASYDDSPAGVFDELVVIAGIVWNPPTSCAWAAKVVVSSNEACQHGRDNVGLPSHVASFSKVGCCSEQRIIGTKGQQAGKANGFLNMIGMDSARFAAKTREATRVTEMNGPAASDIFSINLIRAVPSQNTRLWKGPLVRMSLPSFSGRTEYNPSLLKYSCQMKCRVRVVRPLNVSEEPLPSSDVETELKGHAVNIAAVNQSTTGVDAGDEQKENRSHLSLSVMLSRPILALEFSCMEMNVEAPLIISQ
ncbi:hypothetical protein Nepgr_016933 [Nepenthes gracilis]|uniref:Protein NEOXANTHIN-DEFICIENT 1 n=1 Tax=Nepenthes gracilis TaxID=150966 RepID=A0AAD3SRG5_NEPGR|nr:hypothetical protein Nepgr_016933 [Nepenthes gracilis]